MQHFINTREFKRDGLHFDKHGYYTKAPPDSREYGEYWDEQTERVLNGYSVGGIRITGDHYYYLNFSQIEKVDESGTVVSKELATPDFWDWDYYYNHLVDIARFGTTQEAFDALKFPFKVNSLKGGLGVIIAKARRKGYSYKERTRASRVFNFFRKKQVLLLASDSKFLYPRGTMTMVREHLDFINDHTAWVKRREYKNTVSHFRASFKYQANPKAPIVERGYKSEIFARTAKDNPDVARGTDPYLAIFEEAGTFGNLKGTYSAVLPSLKAGKYKTGFCAIFGTGNEQEEGALDFSEMFYNPEAYELIACESLWEDEFAAGGIGFFVPSYMNMEGYMDEDGNSLVEAAKQKGLSDADDIAKNTKDYSLVDKFWREYPHKPSQSFMLGQYNEFPTLEIKAQLSRVLEGKTPKPIPYLLNFAAGGVVEARPALKGEVHPILSYPAPKDKDMTGAVVVYEPPIENPPHDLYLIGYDPIDQDEGTSLASVIVYKKAYTLSQTRDVVVAEYYGRPASPDDANMIALLLAEWYNASIMHENMNREVRTFFLKMKKYHRLADQPDNVISVSIKKSSVKRGKGAHVSPQLKKTGLKYQKQWMLTPKDVDVDGELILNIHEVWSQRLLQEWLFFGKGNFDGVSAFTLIQFMLNDDVDSKSMIKASDVDDDIKEQLREYYKTTNDLVSGLPTSGGYFNNFDL